MLKKNIVHVRNLLGFLKEKYNGVFLVGYNSITKLPINISIDYDASFGTTDKQSECNYIILNGNLYYVDDYNSSLIRCGTSEKWSCVSGEGDSFFGYYAYGIDDGKLYALTSSTITQIGSATKWTMVAGNSEDDGTFGVAYGISGGKLYRLIGTSITQVGSSTGWTYVQGKSDKRGYYAFGINNGKLYLISNTTITQVGTATNFTEVQGDYQSNVGCGLAKTSDGKLHYFIGNNIEEVSPQYNWSDFAFEYAISNGKLYYIDGSDAAQIGDSINWEKVSHNYAINKGIVYSLMSGTVRKKDVQQCKGIYGSNNAVALCKVE